MSGIALTYFLGRCWLRPLLGLCFISSIEVHTQPSTPSNTFDRLLNTSSWSVDSVVTLPHQFVVARSETVWLAGERLARGVQYSIDYRFGRVSFDSAFVKDFRREGVNFVPQVRIAYRYFPLAFKEKYYLRRPIVLRDSTGNDSIRVAPVSAPLSLSEMFGSDIQKSGSIFRGFVVGSNRDFTVNSGLRLQFSGRISNDLEIAASLTDENTPIQPEGTTQTLQEFDNVFVELKGTDYAATLGDFHFEAEGSEFGRIKRKLSGGQGTATYRIGNNSGTTVIAGAVAKGQFHSMPFQGLESVQGPYRLTGRNGERNIIVLAGTERVYLNGERMLRGETNDYTIDYGIGEVRFTTRRPITSSSRIVVDFEYSDRQFSRSLIGASTEANLIDRSLVFRASFFREADDPDNPIDFAITDSAKTILSAAGNRRENAVVSGVTQVDSNGFYIRIDSILANGSPVVIYRYAPGTRATYVVRFSQVGFGKGDYIRQGLGVFAWKGPGAGDYLPIQFLPMPTDHQQLDLRVETHPRTDLTASAEFAQSVFDPNRFSALDDEKNNGKAFSLGASYAPATIEIGGSTLGAASFSVKHRFLGDRFNPIDRIDDVDFNRKWGTDSILAGDERTTEGLISYSPTKDLSFGGGVGTFHRGEFFSTTRTNAFFNSVGEELPVSEYQFERLKSEDNRFGTDASWNRHKGRIEKSFSSVTPFASVETERRRIRSIPGDSLVLGSFGYESLGGGIRWENIGPATVSARVDVRGDDSLLAGSLSRESESVTQTYEALIDDGQSLSSNLNIVLRSRRPSETFRRLGRIENKTVLVRSQTRYSPFNRALETDFLYDVATERSSKLERVFLKVAPGSGNYRYVGDLNANGVADESEFEMTRFDGDFVVVSVPTEELFPVIDLRTGLRVRLRPSLIIRNPDGALEKFLSIISTETYVRLEEKSTEKDLAKIYLLSLKNFLNDSTTISGSNLFTQDVHFFEGRPEFSARIRFSQRNSLNNFSTGLEKGFGRERSLRIRWQLVTEIANQIEFVNKVDNLQSNVFGRPHQITANAFSFDLSYRPEQEIEVGMNFDGGTSTDDFQNPPVDASVNTQVLRFVYAFRGAGQARLEVGREELNVSRTTTELPFELTGGRIPGKTWLWRVSIDYRLVHFVQATLSYNGRTEGGRSPIHNAQAEVRAFF